MVKVPDWDQFKSSAPLPKPGPLPIEDWTKEELIKINRFIVSFNNIQTFDVDVLKWKYLSELELMFNNITTHNENLWQHPELVNLAINSNST